MKKTLSILCAAAVALSSFGSFAQDRDHDHDRGPDRHDRRESNRPQPPAARHDDHRRNDPRPNLVVERGAGPNHDFRRGGRLPANYRHKQYVVDDWRGHHLSAPPRGYHWVQTGSDYVLVAVATGIIAQILLSQ